MVLASQQGQALPISAFWSRDQTNWGSKHNQEGQLNRVFHSSAYKSKYTLFFTILRILFRTFILQKLLILPSSLFECPQESTFVE